MSGDLTRNLFQIAVLTRCYVYSLVQKTGGQTGGKVSGSKNIDIEAECRLPIIITFSFKD